MEWPDPALKVRDRARFARCTACSPRLCDDACRVLAELGARGATAPAREGAGEAWAWQAELGRLMEGARAPATEGGGGEEEDLPFSFTDEGQAR